MNPLLKTPSSDFSGIRDGRNSLPLYIDVDLTAARSIGSNSHLILNIAGNSFYSDADTANGGKAVVHFQDTNLGNSSAPFFVSPGFIANVGFTQLLIENTAQAGKRLRIFYGVDIDFQAGVNSSITIAGTVTIDNGPSSPANVALSGYTYGSSYQSATIMSANTPDTVFLAGANVNGAIIHDAAFMNNCSSTGYGTFIAKATAPASITDGVVILGPDAVAFGASVFIGGSLKHPVKIPAGLGLFYICASNEVSSHRHCKYTLLP